MMMDILLYLLTHETKNASIVDTIGSTFSRQDDSQKDTL